MDETPNDIDELISKIEADSSSSAVEIAQSEKYGRHLIAARDIKTDQGRMGDFPIDEYRQIYDLHISVRLDDIDELVQDSAIHLVICAKHTSIFKKIFDPDTVTVEKLMNNDDMIFMGALLLRFCIVAEYHSLTSVRRPECEKEKPCDVDGYGSISSSFGVRTSFASHSCIPNANKCMIKSNQVILYSILPIKKGSRICDSLSPSVFSGAPKRERQKYFEQHHGFSCDCQACQEDWPDIVYEDDILEYFSGVAPTLSGRTLEIVEKFRHELNLAYASDDSSPMEMLTKFSKLIQDSLDESPLPAKLTAFMIRWFAVLFDYTQGFPNRSRVSDECPS
ncbi:hypothetical protein QAD02_011601 [Eretmocerus hayati]|uniref:Uncharacterized protein n=1 Tax=Eretmocerus hayati TaxID=131215 RepID=A0ACC2NX86_9HYME|nr:hypothetical protein QAD02_011601 [Eretmocerus hayati]